MMSRNVHLTIPVEMLESLNKIAKKENKPRSFVIREMLQRGIEERKTNAK
jgi:metal-responsive CopG/Arc/MetJ family transcriptional regulator